MSVEQDAATVLALEAPAKELLKAIKEARPAITRLRKVNYPGIGSVSYQLEQTTGITDGQLDGVVSSLDAFSRGGGNQAALDYYELCVKFKLSLGQAAYEIMDTNHGEGDDLERVVALRHYAATGGK